MERPDITDDLVHFIRSKTVLDALAVLQTILGEGLLRGGDRAIRGGHRCVCFSEAPIEYLGDAVTRSDATPRYQPFGIIVEKRWLFAEGGRPVIYQPDGDYVRLPEDLRWRHVRYEPLREPPVDFTWEREWRIQIDELPIDPHCARVVVPRQGVAEELVAEHEYEEFWGAQWRVQVEGMEEQIADMLREDFPWEIVVIDEL